MATQRVQNLNQPSEDLTKPELKSSAMPSPLTLVAASNTFHINTNPDSSWELLQGLKENNMINKSNRKWF